MIAEGNSSIWRRINFLPVALLALFLIGACSTGRARIVYITATPVSLAHALAVEEVASPTAAAPTATHAPPATLNPTALPSTPVSEYIVQAGDTLSAIAARHHTTMESLIALNQIANPNWISVGQVLKLPGLPALTSPAVKTLPDAALIRGPVSGDFDLAAFIEQQPGYLRGYAEQWGYGAAAGGAISETRSAAAIIERVSLAYSIDARVLLTLLEHLGQWLSDPLPEARRLNQPIVIGNLPPVGLDAQLSWAADWLNRGYYGWKYGTLVSLQDQGGESHRIAPGLNAASVALQSLYSQVNASPRWQTDVSSEGFARVYRRYFGDPFARASDDVLPAALEQPPFQLPFAAGETWYFTGGPHPSWGAYSPWGALDFAPPDAGQGFSNCFISQFPVRAMAGGRVIYSDAGMVLQDLDGDGDPGSGWLLLYMHISAGERAARGSLLAAGDVIGFPSCEGGYSTATHVHIARRYQGEWLPADCQDCPVHLNIPVFNLGGWQAESILHRLYQGRLRRGDEIRVADQGRGNPDNQVSW